MPCLSVTDCKGTCLIFGECYSEESNENATLTIYKRLEIPLTCFDREEDIKRVTVES